MSGPALSARAKEIAPSALGRPPSRNGTLASSRGIIFSVSIKAAGDVPVAKYDSGDRAVCPYKSATCCIIITARRSNQIAFTLCASDDLMWH
jgi:hypothetical protein